MRPALSEGRSKARPEGSPRPPQHGHEHEGRDGLDHLAVADQMKRHRPGEQPDRDEPSQALASSHAAGDRQEPDAGERDESSCSLAHSEGDVAEQGMQPPPDLRWHDGGDEVGEPEDRDPGCSEAPHSPEAAGGIGEERPHAPTGERGDHLGLAALVHEAPGRESLQHRHRAQVPAGEQEPRVHFHARLDLDPGDLLDVDEDRRQAEARRPFLHDFAAGTGVRVKARPDPRELGLEGMARDEADASCGEDRARRLTSLVIGVVGRGAEQRSPGRMPDPVIDHGQDDPGHDHLGHEGEPETRAAGTRRARASSARRKTTSRAASPEVRPRWGPGATTATGRCGGR